MSFYEKSLRILELPSVLELLSREAVSAAAKEAALSLTPSGEAREVERRIAQTSDAKRMMISKGSPSFYGVRDVRAGLSRAELGGVLNPRELLDIAAVLCSARAVKSYISDFAAEKSSIDYLFASLRANKYLEETISSSILSEDEIADSASADLADIRRKMRAASSSAKEALRKIVSSTTYAKALQEPIITTRSDRYVVPVKVEYKSLVPGLVHDVSSSGMTLFIEPISVVNANNELRELVSKEKLEIERILALLSAQCADYADDISSDFSYLVQLDLIFAKARLSQKLNCSPAEQSDKVIRLHKSRHPLLDPGKAVPIDVNLGGDFDTLVITGPNTGGKTVSLKTIGLLAAMNQCGLHIPAAYDSCLPVFSRILSDIGDEQSIEQSLSTFSSHMCNIIKILEECDDNTLVLFDELGAGTDPTEGAALAISIIEYARDKGSLIAATTHYSELKVYATNERGVQNASCEFDVETLRPTFKLLVGIPGKSNAFAIAKRLGLGEDIINDAKSRLSSADSDFEATIEKLEQTRVIMERDRETAEKQLAKANEELKKASRLRAELEVKLEQSAEKSKREAEEIIRQTRATVEEIFDEIDKLRDNTAAFVDPQSENEIRSRIRQTLNAAENDLKPELVEVPEYESLGPLAPGCRVKHKTIGIEADVIKILPDGLLSLRAGEMSLEANEEDVIVIGKAKTQKRSPKSSHSIKNHSALISTSIDLRGMESIEATVVAERYIDNAIMAKLKTVTIIHGKGTGALRAAVQKMLKHNKHVKSFRLGRYGEGEAGVTIVELI